VFNPPPRKPKSLREKSGRVGHPGAQLEMRAEPEVVVPHIPTECARCKAPLSSPVNPLAEDYIERRQVFDLKMILEVTEHRSLLTVPSPVHIGPGVQIFLPYSHICQ